MGENRIGEALEQARKVVELAPGDGRAYPQLATLLIKQQRYDEAIQVSRAGLGVTPFNPELRFALGTALVSRNEATEGMAQLQLAAGLKPAVPATSAGGGLVPPKQAALDEPAGRSASDAGSRVAEARLHTQLAAALLSQGKLEEASRQYRAALAIEPHSETARCGLGEALSKQGRYAEAIEQLLQALKIRSDCVPALVQLGIARARQGKLDEAMEALSEAVRIQPGDAGAHNSLGNILAQQGKHEEAVRQFEEAVRLEPAHAAAHNNLAISCKKLGRVGEAIAHYQEAIRLQPDFLQALNNLAWTLAAHPNAQFRNGTGAVQLATRACELTKYQNPVPLGTLAAAYAETGKFHEAVSFAERAQELARGGQPALAAHLSAMLEAFRAGRPYHAD
jgi:tetratricopeptide (TPR) repeat protein